ncbi:hypothetical protein G5S34_17455 [Herbaspirillum frisingense]|uniref:hypothetical protein n=1 Tax=Herbaspirillum frisingense TaxID=92645 RepID=UPI001600B659|nr:hypothetical protein [Herbaspirillum frisingense]QNB08362.1 hypothetical protein G5S34_17455 [Herbaspirillum frisingense]
MTDRIHSFTVVLEHDMRADDAETLANAIRHLRGVISVGSNISEPGQYVAEQRVRSDLGGKLWEVLYPSKGGSQ